MTRNSQFTPQISTKNQITSQSQLNKSQLGNDTHLFIKNSVLQSFQWPSFEHVLDKHWENTAARGGSAIDSFPLAACLAAGGTVQQAMPVAASWSLYLFAGRIFDDLADGEGADSELFTGSDAPTPLSTCLFAVSAATAALSSLDDPAAYRDIATTFSHTLALAAKSENVQPSLSSLSVEAYFETIAAKTGIVFATGAWAGGRTATVDADMLNALHSYGLHVGMMTQILDDCVDLKTDLLNQVWTLPLIDGLSQTTHPLYEQLNALIHQQCQTEKWADAVVDTLTRMNALSRSHHLAEVHRQEAVRAIASLPFHNELLMYYVTPKAE